MGLYILGGAAVHFQLFLSEKTPCLKARGFAVYVPAVFVVRTKTCFFKARGFVVYVPAVFVFLFQGKSICFKRTGFRSLRSRRFLFFFREKHLF